MPDELEWDGIDADCRHALAEDAAGRPIGCGRLLPDGHIGRMAVLRDWRGRGVGAALLARLIAEARARRARERRAQRADAGAGVLRAARLRARRRRVRRGGHRAPRDAARPGLNAVAQRPRRRNASRDLAAGRAVGVERALDELQVARAVDGEDRRAARAVVVADDERRRQPPFPLERHAGRRQLVVGGDGAVGEEVEQRVEARSAGGAPTRAAPRRCADLRPGRVERVRSTARGCPRASVRGEAARFDAQARRSRRRPAG